MDMDEIMIPDFLQHHSTDDIHQKMIDMLPDDLDISEGGHSWNFTRPTALVAAEIAEYLLPEVIRLIFPETAYGEFLDSHARTRGITRRAATAATGKINITGAVSTIIPSGSLFSTESINDEPSVDYETIESATIPEDGTVTVGIRCTKTGTIGNVQAGTITVVASKITGLTAISNAEELSGGTEEEDDESLQERILEYDKSQGDSYTGSIADYKRWAKSVPGVGDATVVPAEDDTGIVTIIITDLNGEPATENLCTSVYNYIMGPDSPESRLAPVNAIIKVIPPETAYLEISGIVELDAGASLDSVKSEFKRDISRYLPNAMDAGEIKLSKICAILSDVNGVNDYSKISIYLKTYEETSEGTLVHSQDGNPNLSISYNTIPIISESNIKINKGAV